MKAMDKTPPPTITLKVGGMSCDHCARAVTAAIQGHEPDAQVAVDLIAVRVVAALQGDLEKMPANLQSVRRSVVKRCVMSLLNWQLKTKLILNWLL